CVTVPTYSLSAVPRKAQSASSPVASSFPMAVRVSLIFPAFSVRGRSITSPSPQTSVVSARPLETRRHPPPQILPAPSVSQTAQASQRPFPAYPAGAPQQRSSSPSTSATSQLPFQLLGVFCSRPTLCPPPPRGCQWSMGFASPEPRFEMRLCRRAETGE